MRRLGTIVLLVLLPRTAAFAQSVHHVDDDAPPGGDGTSWATAFPTLQDALAVAQENDSIRIAQGTQHPDRGGGQVAGDRQATFELIGGLVLEGGYRGLSGGGAPDDRDPALFVSFLSGDLAGNDLPGFVNAGENSRHVLQAVDASAPITLDGLSIVGGNADGASAVRGRGGGMRVIASDVLLRDCAVVSCRSNLLGGGLYVEESRLDGVDVLFRDVSAGDSGGGICLSEGELHIEGGRFEDALANDYGGGVAVFGADPSTLERCDFLRCEGGISGGGLRLGSSSAILRECSFEACFSPGPGGGISTSPSESLTVERCSFTGNEGRNQGGAIHSSLDVLTVVGSTFEDNWSDGSAGAVSASGGLASFEGCHFARNEGPGIGGALYAGAEQLLVRDCVFEDNEGGSGGAIFLGSVTHGNIERSRFVANESQQSGGALMVSVSSRIVDCSFIGNDAGNTGGALLAGDSDLIGCTLWNNRASSAGGGVYSDDLADLESCILWGNEDLFGTGEDSQIGYAATASFTVEYCAVQGWSGAYGGRGNHALDPQFVDRDGADDIAGNADDDLRLTRSSPCVEAGNPALFSTGRDVAGGPRLLDADFDRVRRQDMGAHEFSHVHLAVTGDATPGGSLTLHTTGTAGLPVFLVIGVESGAVEFPPFGPVFVDFSSYWRLRYLTVIPGSDAFVIPPSAPTPLGIVLQEIARDPPSSAGNTSNPVSITIL